MPVRLNTDVDDLLKRIRNRYAGMKNLRDPYIPLWTDIRDFLAPRTARINGELQDRGERQDLNIINSTPRFAVRTLAAGMQSGVTSPLRPWFRLATPDPDLDNFKPVKVWLSEVERRMRSVMSRSNIYDRLKSNYGILGTYGTSCLFIDEDEEDVIRAYDFAIGSWCFAQDERGRVTAMSRDVFMTVNQWVRRFGLDNIPSYVKSQYDRGNYEEKYPLVHMVEPNRLFKPGVQLSQNKPWASIWMQLDKSGEEAILQYKGYDSQPFFGPRWDITAGEDVYGSGCGEMAIGDSKQLQLQEKRGLQVLDKFTHPTMVGDGSLKNQRQQNLPGETVYINGLVSGRGGYFPAYQISNPYLNVIEEKQRQIERRIDEAFYKNLFLLVAQLGDQPNITATQINTMREEKLMMLGPVLERLNDELLDPALDRIFDIMLRRGMFPPPPQELAGVNLRVEYINILAQAQKATSIGNIDRFGSFVGNMASFNPSALAKFNAFAAIDEYADGTGVPPRIVNTDDEANAQIAQQQRLAQQQQAIDNAPQLADALKKVSETQIQGEPAIDRVVNG